MSYTVKGRPFVFKGVTDVTDCITAEEVMEKSGLDWNVEKCELVAKIPTNDIYNKNKKGFIYNSALYIDCPNAFATYRTDENIPLGIVKDKYTIVQNINAFNFFNDAIGKDKAIWQTAGLFDNGKRIFVSAKLPNNILVNGDPVENYLVFVNGHDGSTGVKILFTPIRVICENTLNAAINTSSNYISFRHTKSVHDNIDIAKEILGICTQKTHMLSQYYNKLHKIKIDDKTAQTIFSKVILTENEIDNINSMGYTVNDIVIKRWRALDDTGISTRKANILQEINDYYFDGIGQREILGTAWGAYNAITGYYSNVDNAEGTKRMDSLLFGDKSRKIEKTMNILLAA